MLREIQRQVTSSQSLSHVINLVVDFAVLQVELVIRAAERV